MLKLFCCVVVFVLVVMVDQTEGWRRRRRRRCYAQYCTVSSWSWWSSCSRSCGWGRQSRERTLTRQSTCGRGCSYSLSDYQSCNNYPCPVHGGWSSWTGWTSCSQSCGTGSQQRSRTCTNPRPAYGGRSCYNYYWSGTGKQTCNTQPCPVHGGWASWSVSTACNVTCGNGTEILSRNCTNPAPNHGGTPCQGASRKEQKCALKPCPIDGGWSTWSEWNYCSKSCGSGFQQRLRNCTQPTPRHGGKGCSGAGRKRRWCYLHPCPVHGRWSSWSLWSPCDKVCGKGVSVRTRSCTNPPPFYGNGCGTHHYESRECAVNRCPVHGGWNAWGPWSPCGKTCGGAVRERTRFCTNPPPFHGGRGCGTHYYESKECAINKCPVHGNWSNWSKWTECSATCGVGARTRERHCDNPRPAYGGRPCEGIHKDKKSCSTGEVCVAGVGCYNSFLSDRLGNFSDEIQWSGLFSSQMQKIVKKCAQLAAEKRKRFFALEDFGNCHGARAFSSGSESKGTRCIFGVGVKSHYFVYEISL
ncbi:coadhesin-like [Montipora capricornis]|uniref:coadhesin-like n=1 Tax=Montipora capricornis TaxID=246305 RepID=UPI0035F1455B